MKTYLECKIILAEPMTENTFLAKYKGKDTTNEKVDRNGYHVVYPELLDIDYHSWTPLASFEGTHREISNGEIKLVFRNIKESDNLFKQIFKAPEED